MIGYLFFKLTKWKKTGYFPDYKKCIVVVAPHTSFIDFYIGKFFYDSMKKNPKFFIKKEAFRFPYGFIVKMLGGVPIDRKHGLNIIDIIVEEFKKNEKLVVTITPEGTRKKTKKWKRGFYYIAQKAQVPVLLGYIDYKKKEVGIIKEFKITK